MDINSWRSSVPVVEKAVELDHSSSSDDELPSLHERFRKMLDPSARPARPASSASASTSTSRHVSSSSQATTIPPTLVPPKAPSTSSMFINQKHRQHIPPARQQQQQQLGQYRQPQQVIEIEDSPPAKQQAPQSRFLSPARQPLTEITSSSSGDSIVQLNTDTATKPSSGSFNSFRHPNSIPPPPAFTPKKPSPDQYAHLPAKARILASFQPQAAGFGTPIGKLHDPTHYTSHAGYQPPANVYSVDPELSGELDPKLIDEINKRIEGKENQFNQALMNNDDQEGALQSLCAEIYTDMTQVEKEIAQPEGLVCTLLKHQIEGVAWLKSREEGKKRGGILADDMGLGKTVQSIALILANRPDSKPKTTLIVAPVSLLPQWKDEIEKKTNCEPRLRVLVHQGGKRTKEARKLMKYDVVLTNYETLRNDFPNPKGKKKKKATSKASSSKQTKLPFLVHGSDGEGDDFDDDEEEEEQEPGPLIEAEFYRVILDEAHTIKNRNNATAKACYGVKAKYRWCLTGTPIQNGITDIFSLFHFLGSSVKPLNDYTTFKSRIETPLKGGKTTLAMKRLHYVLASVMLRRTKTMKIDGKPLIVLPPRTVEIIKTDFLDKEEREYYKAVEARVQLEFNKYLKSGSINSEYMAVLTLLLRLRQICNHPDLVNKGNDREDREVKVARTPTTDAKEKGTLSDDDLDDLVAAFGNVGFANKICTLCQTSYRPTIKESKFCLECEGVFKGYSEHNSSTKIIKIIELLKQMKAEDPDRKAIVFSQFTSFFDILRPFLKRAGIKFVVYQGSMDSKKREESLTAIRDDPRTTVILVSLKAGAQGLNLTCCSTVFMVDLWWNPAIENQAFDRAHRMGQKKEVKIFKFVISETVEEKILELQEKKKAIADAAIDGGNVKELNRLSTKDLMRLFNMDHDVDTNPGPSHKPLSTTTGNFIQGVVLNDLVFIY